MTSLKNNEDRLLYWLFALTVGLYFVRLGFPAVWNPNEAFYFETPREMLERGDLLTPYFNYEYRFQKPPMLYWFIALSNMIFGFGEYQVRGVSVFFGLLTIGVTYYLAKNIWGSRRAGLMSAIVMSLAFDFNMNIRYASPELILTGLSSLSLAIFYKWYSTEPRKKHWLYLFYLVCGLTTLTKGPFGLMMPSMIIIPWLLLNKDYKTLKSAISPVGILIYLGVSVPWYALMISQYGSTFTDVVWDENVKRFLTKKSRQSNPLFYFTVLPWNFFPGSLFLVPALVALRKLPDHLKALRFPIIWAVAVFVFFSIASTKLPPYLIPIFPALSVIVGGWLDSVSSDVRWGRTVKYLSIAGLLVAVSALVWLKWFLPGVSILWAVFGAVALVLAVLRYADARRFALLLFAGTFVLYVAFVVDVLNVTESKRDYRVMAKDVKKFDPAKTYKFYTVIEFQKSLVYYLERKMTRIASDDEVREKFQSSEPTMFLIKKERYESLKKSGAIKDERLVWSGRYYEKSESRFYRFLKDISDGKIEEYVIVANNRLPK